MYFQKKDSPLSDVTHNAMIPAIIHIVQFVCVLGEFSFIVVLGVRRVRTLGRRWVLTYLVH